MLVEVVQSLDDTGELICSRFPPSGEADLKLGAQVIVRESQSAVFFRGGKALDTFGPGRHTLTTGNVPILMKAIGLAVFKGDTPFKAEVVFVNHKVFTNQKWGTKEPIAFRDAELSLVRLRAFGIMSFKVEDAQLFVNKIVGTQGMYSTQQIEDFLRGIVIGRLADFLGENLKSVFDLPRYYDEIGTGMKARVRDDFAKYGIGCEDFIINAITPPEEVQKKIDERSAMAAVGNLDQYMKFKAAQALQDAANQPGGTAGAGVGAGLGFGMGMMMPNMMAGMMPQAGTGAAAGGAMAGAMLACGKCQHPNPAGTKFCGQCGAPLAAGVSCPKCKAPNPAGTKFCGQCGAPLQATGGKCPKCQADNAPGTKFCGNCGNPL
ncbi:MAG: SPFH domain-containing protein [Myxococcales bacterium]|nr:SPFH domain-containing protein [Myxococcales bacterium]